MTLRHKVNRIALLLLLLLLLSSAVSRAGALNLGRAEAATAVTDPSQLYLQQLVSPQTAPPQRPPTPPRPPRDSGDEPTAFESFTGEVDYENYDSRVYTIEDGRLKRAAVTGLADPSRRPVYDIRGTLTGPSSSDLTDIASNFLNSQLDTIVSAQDSGAQLSLDPAYQFSLREGAPTHLVYRETFDGIPVFGGDAQVDVLVDGSVVRADVPGSVYTPSVLSGERLSAEDAIRVAASAVVPGRIFTLEKTGALEGADQQTTFEGTGGIGEVNTSLVYFPSVAGTELGWQIFLSPSHDKYYEIVVDAESGDVLFSHNLAVSEAPEGNVFAAPSIHNPDINPPSIEPFTGYPPGPADCFQQPVNFGGDCWVAADGPGHTYGNNVVSWVDPDEDNFFEAAPSPTGDRHFNFPFSDSYNLTGDLLPDAGIATTNLFYWNNVIHDWLYALGFKESAGNFQFDNFGRGGAGLDRVRAFSQVGTTVNNAFMATPPDGFSPRMVMGAFLNSYPMRRVDSSLDAGIIVHEYVHGLTNRVVGGPSNSGALNGPQSAGMGEGWSDAYAVSFTGEPTIGRYVVESSTGIRTVAYDDSTHTFGLFGTLLAIPQNAGISLGHPEVHRDGEIWATVLYDLRQEMIAADPVLGQNDFEFLVTEALAFTPANPSMLDARDAILLAAGIPGILIGNPTLTQCDVFGVFAGRGFGASASLNHVQAGLSPEWALSVFEAFDLPPECGGTPIGPGADVFTDDMETGPNGWTADGDWHQSTLNAADGTTSWYFGDDATGTFDSFVPNIGSLTSPVIDLTGVDRATIEWDQNLRTQGIVSPIFSPESGWLLISRDFGESWETATILTHDSSGLEFNHHAVDISRFAGGPIMAAFHFDSGFGPESPVPVPVPGGWFIDNFRVAGHPQLDADDGSLTLGTPTQATIDHFGDSDTFVFDGTQGDFVEIVSVAGPGSNLNPALAVVSPSGILIAQDDAGKDGELSSLILPLPETGTYEVIALGRNSMGGFEIEANSVVIDDDDGGSISGGGNIAGTVDFNGDEDEFTFGGLTGQVVQIDIHQTTGSGLNPVVELIAPDGTVVFADNSSGQGNSALLVTPLSQDGEYTARVLGNLSTGDYDLSVSFTSVTNTGGGPLVSGTPENGGIDYSQDADYWTFNAITSDLVRVIVTASPGSPIDPRAWLFLSSEEVAFDDNHGPGNGAMIEMELRETGEFSVIVAAGDNAIGGYDIRYEVVPDAGEGVFIGFDPPVVGLGSGHGNTALGSIDVPGDTDFVQFFGEAGTPVVIRMQKTENNVVDNAFDLLDPSGNYVDTGRFGSPFHFTSDALLPIETPVVLQETGFYSIWPYSQNSGMGGYKITLAQDVGGGPIALGQTVHGSIDLGTEGDPWFFSLTETTDVSMLYGPPPEVDEVSAASHTSGVFIPALLLFDERDLFNPLAESVANFPDQPIAINATLAAGNYIIGASAALPESVGEYQLTLFPTSVGADIEVKKFAAPDPVVTGDLLTYRIVVTNNGPVVATNVEVWDVLPSSTVPVDFDPGTLDCAVGPDPTTGVAVVACELGVLAPGQAESVFIGVSVEESVPTGTVLTNYVVVGADQLDPVPGNNQSWTDTEVISSGFIGPVLIRPHAPDVVLGGLPLEAAILAWDLPVISDESADPTTTGALTQPLQGAQYVVGYDPSLLVPIDIIPGYDISDCKPVANTNIPGAIQLAFACPSGRSGTPLHMWTLVFDTAPVTDVTRTSLLVSEVLLGDDSLQPELIEGIGGGIEFDIFPGICGDLTGDDVVNILDTIIASQIIVGDIDPTLAQSLLGNVDLNGDITVLDLIRILQFVVGHVSELQCGEGQNNS